MGITITDDDIDKMAKAISNRIVDIKMGEITPNRQYSEYSDDVLVEGDRLEFIIAFKDGKCEIVDLCYILGSYEYYFGSINRTKINIKLAI